MLGVSMRAPIVLYQPPRRLRTDYRVGLSAWTDKSMLEESEFYPRKTMTPEERLWWYSRFFDTVEVNSTFYALVAPATSAAWAARTDPGFIFNVKAYGLLTGHAVEAARLPDPLRTILGGPARAAVTLPGGAAGDEARTWIFEELRKGLQPLRKAGKLGYVLFQLAPWVTRSDDALAYLATLPRALPGTDVAIELRNRSWFGAQTEDTLRFLAHHGLTYVSIDGPRSRALTPSLPALTTATAVFRLHGRNFAGHLKQLQGKHPSVAEKYDYLYSTTELEEIARAAGALNGRAARVHLAMNNNRRDYPVTNGLQLKAMLLEDWRAPARAELIEELEARRASRSRSTARRAGIGIA
jgi:uncharacterized protein YecE (DUF72 family)